MDTVTNRMPAADVDVSPGLVRGPLADQHPDLARLPAESVFMAYSADNPVMLAIGERTVSRVYEPADW